MGHQEMAQLVSNGEASAATAGRAIDEDKSATAAGVGYEAALKSVRCDIADFLDVELTGNFLDGYPPA
jgi:hypothetical protein